MTAPPMIFRLVSRAVIKESLVLSIMAMPCFFPAAFRLSEYEDDSFKMARASLNRIGEERKLAASLSLMGRAVIMDPSFVTWI
eukprot:CCRYP_007205-RA/>CCRYP_007205-RA protein AED:0.42 eAED:0.47 QI:0/0/0.5/1/0/0/2/533/82